MRRLGQIWVLVAALSGVLFSGVWIGSSRAWDRHLTQSFVAGFSLYEALRQGTPLPQDIRAEPMSHEQSALAEAGRFERLNQAPHPAYVTNLSIHSSSIDPLLGDTLTLAIVSDRLRYRVGDITPRAEASAAEKLGNVTQILATYCSNPVIYARYGLGPWLQVNGTSIWGCSARPTDWRLPAAFGLFLVMAVLLSQVVRVASLFEAFARRLRQHRRLGGPESYESDGPSELKEVVEAVNLYLEAEHDSLSKRAVVLSGISHDLGTPATRLRLRARLIEDAALRSKLEGDIDQMTGMIESVLTYTRAELNLEEPRELSLSSLVEALVDDYRDVGHPVDLVENAPLVVHGMGSLFQSRKGSATIPQDRRVIVTCRPVGLQRALSNLIDNAIKYGRTARVTLQADSRFATVLIEDEGTEFTLDDINRMMAPFQRGHNTTQIEGTGLGLSIVVTIVSIHGGTLTFEQGDVGLRARVVLPR
ncbi:sensor histidine kinase [Epibacterium ulvae]|uniref:sensor histidine kinase n=1 Tax=Epibacterium ulvae TaxID=1156985 RepID=UPI00203F9861|nr:HAMP domain-containing sensor histidine kinase [Epibacterium ulvae]